MAITIVTQNTFATDDGTVYNDTFSEEIDQDNDADLPLRYQFPIGTTREQFLDFSTAEAFAQGFETAYNTIFIVNRDDSNSCTLYLTDTAADEYFVTLGPDEWHYLPTSQMAAGTGAAPPLVNIQSIDAAFTNAAGTIEVLVFSNPGS